jgi:hypothetical protein
LNRLARKHTFAKHINEINKKNCEKLMIKIRIFNFHDLPPCPAVADGPAALADRKTAVAM